MKTEANDPINPVEVRTSLYAEVPPTMLEGGLTKREYFAAMAMQGMLATESLTAEFSGDLGVFAEQAVISADCLIEELNKKKMVPNE